MFRIGVKRFTWIAVKWAGLADDGSAVENEVELRIELVDRSTLKTTLLAEAMDGADARDFLSRITQDWRGVGDVEGHPLSFNPENFALLLEAPGFTAAMGTAYVGAWNGQASIREKNSEPSPAAGPAEEAGEKQKSAS